MLVILLIIVAGGIAYFAGKNPAPKMEISDNSKYYPPVEQNTNPPVAPTPSQTSNPPSVVSCGSPSIKVLSPNGGETYTNTDKLEVTWKSCGMSSSTNLAVEIMSGTDSLLTAFVPNTGSYTFQLSPSALMNSPVPPSQPVTYGDHFKVQVGTTPGASPSYHDSSDTVFTIK